jgi:hypothetical protein
MQSPSHYQHTTMSTTSLRVLQLNIMKSRAGMEALINDSRTQDLDVLLIQEPPMTAYRTHVNHRLWHLYQPTYTDADTRKRSLIYVNKRISTSSHRQVQCPHPDVTAVRLWTGHSQVLVFSIYIPPLDLHNLYEIQSAQGIFDAIDLTIQEQKASSHTPTTLLLAGDFNRHHPAWSHTRSHSWSPCFS